MRPKAARLTCIPAFLAAVATIAAARVASAAPTAETVRVEPRVWNYGVRPQRHLVTKRVRFVAAEGLRARIGLVQINCSCLAAKVLRREGPGGSPPELEITMDTERFDGRTTHYAFVNLEEPERRLVRVEITGWTRPGNGPGEVEVFFAREEATGRGFMEWWRANAAPAAGIVGAGGAARVKLLPIEDVANYTRMRELERAGGLAGPAPDVVAFVDGRIALAGADEVRAGLRGFLNLDRDGRPGSLHPDGDEPGPPPSTESDDMRSDSEAPAAAGDVPPTPGGGEGARALEVEIYYFSDCRHCREALALAREIGKVRGDAVRVSVFDTAAEREAVPRLFALVRANTSGPLVLPSMIAFVGDGILMGEEAVLRGLGPLVDEQLARGGAHLAVRRPAAEPSAARELTFVALAPVLLAGLADGVNPCAFAAMVLLVSILSASAASGGSGDRARGGLLLGGGAFLAAVFATYFLAGLALLRGARAIEGYSLIEAVVFWAVWALAAAGAVISAADAVAYLRTGDTGRVILKVPEALRRRFAGVIGGRFRRMGLVGGGVTAGVAIALLEGVCTGQMYLPAIRYMAGTPGLRARGVSLLLLYNALFVLPLAAILAAAVAGVHYRRLNGFLRRHLGAAKAILAIVFGALAAAMVVQRFSA